jgi:hypothetical protein
MQERRPLKNIAPAQKERRRTNRSEGWKILEKVIAGLLPVDILNQKLRHANR